MINRVYTISLLLVLLITSVQANWSVLFKLINTDKIYKKSYYDKANIMLDKNNINEASRLYLEYLNSTKVIYEKSNNENIRNLVNINHKLAENRILAITLLKIEIKPSPSINKKFLE